MDQQQKLQEILDQHSLQLHHSDKLFYSKYLYRLTVVFPRYVNLWSRTLNEISSIRKFAKKQGDRVRLEHNSKVNYYTNNLNDVEKVIRYTLSVAKGQEEWGDNILDWAYVDDITVFPGEITERNIRYRKKSLPFKKYQFQLIGCRMSHEEIIDWREWALQYPYKIKLPTYGTHGMDQATKVVGLLGNPFSGGFARWHRTNGIWAGEALGYVEDEKMLQLAQFKLGGHINKIIEYQIKGTE